MASPRVCKDCVVDAAAGHPIQLRRPAPHPGPRCATHHRAFAKRSKLAAKDRQVQRRFGLGPGEYERLLQLQGGRCAICQIATGKSKRLAVDHDHKCCPGPTSCGACVRGLLCSPCNRMLGRAHDSATLFYRAAAYVADPQILWPKEVLRASLDHSQGEDPPAGPAPCPA